MKMKYLRNFNLFNSSKDFKVEAKTLSDEEVMKLLKSEEEFYNLKTNVIQDITDLLFDYYNISDKTKEELENQFKEGSDDLLKFLNDLEEFDWFDYKMTPQILNWLKDFIQDWEPYETEEYLDEN